MTSCNAGERTLSSSAPIFTSAHWNAAQTVTVTGVGDAVDDGDIAHTIAGNASSSHPTPQPCPP